MRYVALAAFAAAVFTTPAVAGGFKLTFVASPQQQVRMVDGVEGLDSSLNGTGVRVIGTEEAFKKRGALQFLFLNDSEASFNAGAENVTVTLDDGTLVPVITPDQLAREERSRQRWRAVAAGLAAMGNSLNAANAGWSHGTVTANSYTTGSYGFARTTTFGTYSSYNAGAAANAQAIANLQNQQTFDRLAEANAAGKEQLRQYLRTTTVDPGNVKGGLITIELPKSVRKSKAPLSLTFAVRTGGEVHTIKAQLVPAR